MKPSHRENLFMKLTTAGDSHAGRRDLVFSLLAYIAVAYGFTWLVHGTLMVLHIPFSTNLDSPARWIYMLGLLGPLLGAVTVTAWCHGRAGVIELLARAARWRFPLRWYLVAIGTVPALYLLNQMLVRAQAPAGFAFFSFPLIPVIDQLWVVIGEEFGWRGFALPRLQALLGSQGASLALGVIWASWHLPMFFVPGSPQHGGHALMDFASYLYGMTCLTVVMVLLYNRSGGSVLVGMLFHGSLNIAAYTIHIPPAGDITNYLLAGMALIAAMLLPRPWFRAQGDAPGLPARWLVRSEGAS